MNRTQLVNLSNTAVADAPPNNITAADVRGFNAELIPSNATLLDDSTFTGINTFNEKVFCTAELNTWYQLAVTPQTTIDLTNILGNLIEISGTNVPILDFGACVGGEIRFLKFNDPCQLSPDGNIVVTSGQTINVESGDSCIVIGRNDGKWIIANYQRYSGLPIIAGEVQSWTVNDAVPTVSESSPNYLVGYRWISKESGGRRKEWISDFDNSSAATWNPNAGSFGMNGDGKTLEINDISLSGFGGGSFITSSDMRFTRVSNKFTINGNIKISDVSGTIGFINFDVTNDNFGLTFDVDTMLGFGSITVNGQPVLNSSFQVYMNSSKLWVETANAWSLDDINIQFRFTLFTVLI